MTLERLRLKLALVLLYLVFIITLASPSSGKYKQQEPEQDCQHDTFFSSDYLWLMILISMVVGFFLARNAVNNIAEHEFYDVDIVAKEVVSSSSYLIAIQPLAATILTPTIASKDKCPFLDNEHLPILSYSIAAIAVVGASIIYMRRKPSGGIKKCQMLYSSTFTFGAFLASMFAILLLVLDLLISEKLSVLWFICATVTLISVSFSCIIVARNRIRTTQVRSFTWSAISHYEMMLKMVNLNPAGSFAARNHLMQIIPLQYAYITNVHAENWQQQLPIGNNWAFQFRGNIPNMSREQAEEFKNLFEKNAFENNFDPSTVFQWHLNEFKKISEELPSNFPQ